MAEQTCDTRQRFSLKLWIAKNFGWSWFTCTQSTGGVAILLCQCPKQSEGLHEIGLTIFLVNLLLFTLFNALLLSTWVTDPSNIKKSFTRAPDCFFYGSWWLTIATIILGAQNYGTSRTGSWLITAIRISYWIYSACTLLSTTIVFVVMSKTQATDSIRSNPPIMLTVFHAMLTGTIAAGIAATQAPEHRLPIIVSGVGYQGFGWILTLIYMSSILPTVLQSGMPYISLRPGLFMMVGTSGYTMVALLGCAKAIPTHYAYFKQHPYSSDILLVLADWTSVFLWVFTFWLFAIAVLISTVELFQFKGETFLNAKMSFRNTWWAFIFPNVGFTLSTIYLGQELESEAVLWVSTVMVVLLTLIWILDVILMGKAIIRSMLDHSSIPFR